MARKRKEQDPKEARLKELVDSLVAGKTPEEIFGKGGLMSELRKRLAESALEGEMVAHLGYEKHAVEGRNRGNSRNGKGSKRVETENGTLAIEVPRDREGTFEPQLIRKRQRRLSDFDEKVLSLYARGMPTREIVEHLEELYGTDVSPALISAVTDAVLEDVKAWQARPLDPLYPVVYLDALHIKLKQSGHVQTCAVYIALGINMEGHKEVLGLWVGEAEGAKFWLSVLTELKSRGLEDILIAAMDGLKGFPDAMAAVYPRTEIQLCVVHMVRNSLKYVSWRHRKRVAHDLRTIYTAMTRDEAESALERFAEAWDDVCPLISRLWRSNWTHLTGFFNYPPSIRKAIYTTNAIESIQAQLRKVTRHRGAFPTVDSVRKVLYLALMKAKERWTMSIIDWPAALYHLSIAFPGRITL
jgi:transposase-like protein